MSKSNAAAAGETVRSVVAAAKEGGRSALEAAKDKGEVGAAAVRTKITKHPGVTLGIAVGVGALLGLGGLALLRLIRRLT